MLPKRLLIASLILICCVQVVPQKLSRHNDVDDPSIIELGRDQLSWHDLGVMLKRIPSSCRRFKIKIWTPAEVPDHKLPVKSAAKELDPKIILNPCPSDQPQAMALLLSTPDPDLMEVIKRQRFLPSRPATAEKLPEFLFGSPQSAFNFFRRQR